MVHGNITVPHTIAASIPVMTVVKAPILMAAIPGPQSTPCTMIHSINTDRTVLPATVMWDQPRIKITRSLTVPGPIIPLLSTAEQKAVPLAVIAPTSMPTIRCRMVRGHQTATHNTNALSAVFVDMRTMITKSMPTRTATDTVMNVHTR